MKFPRSFSSLLAICFLSLANGKPSGDPCYSARLVGDDENRCIFYVCVHSKPYKLPCPEGVGVPAGYKGSNSPCVDTSVYCDGRGEESELRRRYHANGPVKRKPKKGEDSMPVEPDGGRGDGGEPIPVLPHDPVTAKPDVNPPADADLPFPIPQFTLENPGAPSPIIPDKPPMRYANQDSSSDPVPDLENQDVYPPPTPHKPMPPVVIDPPDPPKPPKPYVPLPDVPPAAVDPPKPPKPYVPLPDVPPAAVDPPKPPKPYVPLPDVPAEPESKETLPIKPLTKLLTSPLYPNPQQYPTPQTDHPKPTEPAQTKPEVSYPPKPEQPSTKTPAKPSPMKPVPSAPYPPIDPQPAKPHPPNSYKPPTVPTTTTTPLPTTTKPYKPSTTASNDPAPTLYAPTEEPDHAEAPGNGGDDDQDDSETIRIKVYNNTKIQGKGEELEDFYTETTCVDACYFRVDPYRCDAATLHVTDKSSGTGKCTLYFGDAACADMVPYSPGWFVYYFIDCSENGDGSRRR
ncbi:vegetative cell wall protein gp1 isoform X2 [Lingula anatina]|uniref:Vegetative cell wall protein gp1 isoform X2 n=1 Tax=Lingula anatina TaxID=7574 RepID=A0A1S3IKN1_LINAN|nr:vegetative cell wall protein gp1 isoform X2 [Lingula anatina]|eukprot:XP_013398772.1 vegetative cell wall protein gp1 isoform X2 [Lingula anatina]